MYTHTQHAQINSPPVSEDIEAAGTEMSLILATNFLTLNNVENMYFTNLKISWIWTKKLPGKVYLE